MLDALVLSHSIEGNANTASPTLVCSWTDGGRDAAWVHVAGELDVATVPQLERTLRELESMDSSGAHALVRNAVRARKAGCDQGESAVAPLLRFADEEPAL